MTGVVPGDRVDSAGVPRTHDEFCFNTDLYQDDVENYMCICSRLMDARAQAVQDAADAPDLHPDIAGLLRDCKQRTLDATREAVAKALVERITDLLACGRDDDCEIKGLGADIAMDDALAAIDSMRGKS